MLVTIAALADRPYDEVRAKAREVLGKPWTSHWARKYSNKPRLSFQQATAIIAHYYGGEALSALVCSSIVPSSAVPVRIERGAKAMTELPAKGRGVVRFSKRNSGRVGHIAPWCDGLIHDTDGSAPCTLAEYLTKHAFWARLDYVRSIAFDGNPEDCISPSPDLGY